MFYQNGNILWWVYKSFLLIEIDMVVSKSIFFMWSNIGDQARELTTYELYKMNGNLIVFSKLKFCKYTIFRNN